MGYLVEVDRAARHVLEKLDRPVRVRLHRALRKLGQDPRPPGSTALRQRHGQYRLRIGAFRIRYVVDRQRNVVTVLDVRHRRASYRQL